MNGERPDEGVVIVRGSGEGFAQEIVAGSHRFLSDEPPRAGGTDTGPTPYDLLLASLGSCTSMTVAMYRDESSGHSSESRFAFATHEGTQKIVRRATRVTHGSPSSNEISRSMEH